MNTGTQTQDPNDETKDCPIQTALNIIRTVQEKDAENYPNNYEHKTWVIYPGPKKQNTVEGWFINSCKCDIPRRLYDLICEKADRLLEKANLGNEIITAIREIKEKVQERFSYISKELTYTTFNSSVDSDGNIILSGIPTESTSDFFNTLITNKIKENTDKAVEDFVNHLRRLGKNEQYLANKIVENFKDHCADHLKKKNKQSEILK